MAGGVYVNVPEPLADSLVGEGFRRAGIKRGIDPGWALAAGANLVTIFASRHEIAEFVARLWAAARGRAAIHTHDSMVAIENGNRRAAITAALAELDEDRPAAVPRPHPQ